MFRAARRWVKRSLLFYPRMLVRRQYEARKFSRHDERPAELAFVFRRLAAIYPQTVLDVGTGQSPLPSVFADCSLCVTAIDNIRDYWPEGVDNHHYYVLDQDITKPTLTSTFDVITCISVLEHVTLPDIAVQNMYSLLNPGGHLLITCPYSEHAYVPNVYKLPGSSYGQDAPYVTQSFSRVELTRWLAATGGSLVDQEYWRYWEGEFWTQGSQLIPPIRADAGSRHQLSCFDIGKPGALKRASRATTSSASWRVTSTDDASGSRAQAGGEAVGVGREREPGGPGPA